MGLGRKFVTHIWRSGVFSGTKLLVFESTGECACRTADSVEVVPGTLAQLACLAAERPEFLTAEKLAEARNRIKRNDIALIVGEGSGCVYVAWMRMGSEIAACDKAGPRCRLPVARPERIVYDYWISPRRHGGGMSPGVLEMIAKPGCRQGERCWVCCPTDNRTLHNAILKAGFRLRYEIQRTLLFGLWSRNRVVTHNP